MSDKIVQQIEVSKILSFNNFNISDEVMLKSGGPVMTITSFRCYMESSKIIASLDAWCQWFNLNNEVQGMWFDIDVLKKYNEKEN
jgi:uncharacterized protein YodC (DUF2158 family)